MPTVIDSLVLQVGFDTKGVKKGEEEAAASLKRVKTDAASTAKEMQSRGDQAAEFFGKIQNKILGATAAFIGFGAAKAAIGESISTVAELGRVAAITGASVKDLSAFSMAIERNGGNAAAATQEVQGFIAAVQKWQSLGQASPELQMFFGTVGAGANTSWLEALKLYADFAEKNKSNPAYVSQVGGWAGLSQNSISEMIKGGAAFSADIERSRQLGVATEKDVEASRKLQESFGGLRQAIDTFTRDLVTKTEPTMKWLLDRLTTDLTHGPQGGLVGESSRALSSQIGEAAKGGIFMDPYSGIMVPIDPAAGGAGSLLDLFRKLEGSGDSAVSSKGAIGRYQITAATAERYGFDASRLKDPAYNEQVASAILADLSKRYGGDKDAMAVAYHSGPGAADKWIAGGRNDATLGPRTRDYLSRERAYTGGGSTTTIQTGPVTVNTQATDAKGIARDLSGALANQANTGLR